MEFSRTPTTRVTVAVIGHSLETTENVYIRTMNQHHSQK